jgi:2,3-bisphosphoglycerate-independent phosphoglycerate mutase
VVDVLVILDGASEPLRAARTSLERARTPVLDALVAEGLLARLRTVPPGLPPGSETAIPGLLGWVPGAPVDRGAVEAAAHGIALGDGERARRVDRRDRADAADTTAALGRRLPRYRVHHLSAHRMLVVGADPLPVLAPELLVWPPGVIPPPMLDERTLLVGACGAAVGVARLMGARTVIPRGASGLPGSDLAAKARAALALIAGGTGRVVVHVGAPDEAAHWRDAVAKAAAIEAADGQLLAPLANALRRADARLRVCSDHGCDPATGAHDGAPVPLLTWRAGSSPQAAGSPRQPAGSPVRRFTERAVATLPVLELAAAGQQSSGHPAERAVAA